MTDAWNDALGRSPFAIYRERGALDVVTTVHIRIFGWRYECHDRLAHAEDRAWRAKDDADALRVELAELRAGYSLAYAASRSGAT